MQVRTASHILLKPKYPEWDSLMRTGSGVCMLGLKMATASWAMGNEAPPQSLLIVCDLNDERDIKGLLEPLCELEGYQVPQVQGLRRWSLQVPGTQEC